MKLNCSYCKHCDTLFDNKFIDIDGACPECGGEMIFMVARPGVSSPTKRAPDVRQAGLGESMTHIHELQFVEKGGVQCSTLGCYVYYSEEHIIKILERLANENASQ